MSIEQGAGGSSRLLGKLTSNLMALRRCRRHDGCERNCAYDRTDDQRLPWTTASYGGWGGHEHAGTAPGIEQTPVVFVHGNQRDACDWDEHAAFFRERCYRGDELWAITFGSASPSHDEMADQLDAFVARTRAYTGASSVAVVSHSLGVTGTRYWLYREDRYDWVETFVGLAGANHGTSLNSLAARTGLTSGTYKMSHFLRNDYEHRSGHPLRELNAEETPGEIDYYTLRGTDDPLFWNCQDSPTLDGAENVAIPADHDEVRESPTAIEYVYEWCSGQHAYNFRRLFAIECDSQDASSDQ
ncbi:MAG: esterase/lipase family protein [Halorientalis sp.]